MRRRASAGCVSAIRAGRRRRVDGAATTNAQGGETTEVATADLDAMQTRLAELDAVKTRGRVEALVVRQATAATKKIAMALRPAEAPAEAPAPAEAAAAPARGAGSCGDRRAARAGHPECARSSWPAEAMATPIRRDAQDGGGAGKHKAPAAPRPRRQRARRPPRPPPPSAAAERAGALRGLWAAKDCPLRQWQLQACASCGGGGGGGTQATSAKLAQTFAQCLAASMRAGEPRGSAAATSSRPPTGGSSARAVSSACAPASGSSKRCGRPRRRPDATCGPPADAQGSSAARRAPRLRAAAVGGRQPGGRADARRRGRRRCSRVSARTGRP